jgi:anaphase-promoting complex subunit 3
VIDSPTEASLQYVADVYLLSIVRTFALSYRALSTFDTTGAISHLDALPLALQSSPLALIAIAIAFYEQADYIRSRRAFTSLFTAEPYRLQGVHLYSTLLWHLADAPALSALAQGAVAITKSRPEVWIAVGNCMSLGGDHEGALRCFKRATQVGGTAAMLGYAQASASGAIRPGMGGCAGEAAYGGQERATAYAYTLAGYEAVELEEYERAVRLYRLAIRTDARSYNAW